MKFKYHGDELEGFDHEYNDTALNERAIEIPIVCQFLEGRSDGDILEVGNVLSHYFPDESTHRIVDLTEVADGVENIDVLDIEGSYDTIVSISTLEHVRWEGRDDQLDPDAALAALRHLQSLLNEGGRMIITIPTGVHLPFEEVLLSGESGAVRECTLSRGKDGRWTQPKKLTSKPYGDPGPWAWSVYIGEFEG